MGENKVTKSSNDPAEKTRENQKKYDWVKELPSCNFSESLPERLFQLRTDMDYTQEYVALKTGYKRTSSYSKVESRNITPSLDKICKFADLYNVSVDYLLGRTDYKDLYNKEMIPPCEQIFHEMVSIMIDFLPEDRRSSFIDEIKSKDK